MGEKQPIDTKYRADWSAERQSEVTAKQVATFQANRTSPMAVKHKAVGREHALSLAAVFKDWVGPRRPLK